MTEINCINMCEISSAFFQSKDSINKIFLECINKNIFSECNRIYIGSNFCGQYFVNLSDKDIKVLYEYCKINNITLTLVLPIVPETLLYSTKRKIDSITNLTIDVLDEITVNDFGMLKYIHNIDSKYINLGRLFFKDKRDQRIRDNSDLNKRPFLFPEGVQYLTYMYNIHGIEIDGYNDVFDFNGLPEQLKLGIHYPYIFTTTGHICEFASVGKNTEEKFRPNNDCQKQCFERFIEYKTSAKYVYWKFGRTVYYEKSFPKILGVKSFRKIYFPMLYYGRGDL